MQFKEEKLVITEEVDSILLTRFTGKKGRSHGTSSENDILEVHAMYNKVFLT